MKSTTNAIVLTGAALAAGALLAGCGSLTSSTSAGGVTTVTVAPTATTSTQVAGTATANPAPATSGPIPVDIGGALHSAIPSGWQYSMVRVHIGGSAIYQAAAYNQNGQIAFWRYRPSSGWATIGQSTYPVSNNPVDAKVTGGQVSGMTNATFVLTALLTNDGAADSIAFTSTDVTNGAGWGAIKAITGGNLAPSGQPVGNDGIGQANEFDVTNGELETADCSATLPISSCGGDQRVFKFWSWNANKQQFVLTRTAGLPS